MNPRHLLSHASLLMVIALGGVLHYVAEGDTVERLQLLYGVAIEDFVAYPGNGFPEEPPYLLTPGQSVRRA